MTKFLNREDAARHLVPYLQAYRSLPNGIVLALPRGGVSLGRSIADALHWPLDVVIVKKIGHPHYPKLAVGSVSATGYVVDKHPRLSADYVAAEVSYHQRKIREKQRRYRQGRPPPIMIRKGKKQRKHPVRFG
jgi:predicted phosphoribosyltransferase